MSTDAERVGAPKEELPGCFKECPIRQICKMQSTIRPDVIVKEWGGGSVGKVPVCRHGACMQIPGTDTHHTHGEMQ